MFWNVSGIILGIALVTTFAVQIVCRILAISISIPVSLINALIVCYLIIIQGQFRVPHRQFHSCHGKALLYRGGLANHSWHQPRYGVQALGTKGVSLDKNRFCLQNLEEEF